MSRPVARWRRQLSFICLVALAGFGCGTGDRAAEPDVDDVDVHVSVSPMPAPLVRMAADLSVDSATAFPAVQAMIFQVALADALWMAEDIQVELSPDDYEAFLPEAGAILGAGMIGRPSVRARPGAVRFSYTTKKPIRRTSVVLGVTVTSGRLLLRIRVVDPDGRVRDELYAGWPDGIGDVSLSEALDRTLRVVEDATNRSISTEGSDLLPYLRGSNGEPFVAVRYLPLALVSDAAPPDWSAVVRALRREGGSGSKSSLVRGLWARVVTTTLADRLGLPGVDGPAPADLGLPEDIDSLAVVARAAADRAVEAGSLGNRLVGQRFFDLAGVWTPRERLERELPATHDDRDARFRLALGLEAVDCWGGYTLMGVWAGLASSVFRDAQLGIFDLPEGQPVPPRGSFPNIPQRFLEDAPEWARAAAAQDEPWMPSRFSQVDAAIGRSLPPDRHGPTGRALRTALAAGDSASPETLDGMVRSRINALRGLSSLVAERDYELAAALSLNGASGEAIALLERALEARTLELTSLERDPALDALRGLPSFERLIDRLYAHLEGERDLYVRLRGAPFSDELAREVVEACLAPI